jgi:hypothetical protein
MMWTVEIVEVLCMKHDWNKSRSTRNLKAIVPELVKSRVQSLTLTILCALFVFVSASAQQTKPSEFQVEAAYVYNFGKFVKWPADAAANRHGGFTICVLGDDPFGTVLQSTLASESLGGKPVAVRRVPTPQDAASCHILFLSTVQETKLKEIVAALGQTPVLTVSDIPEFSQRGGMIQFVLQGDRVRFEINRANAESDGLILTSDLLKVAVVVRGSVRKGGQ